MNTIWTSKLLTKGLLILTLNWGCTSPTSSQTTPVTEIIDTKGTTIETRFLPPSGFEREKAASHSFAAYLRQLPLKAHGANVLFYNGHTKPNYNTYDAVVNLPIGKRDLHQCADAIMRLRAEHLWKEKKFDQIHFNFTNGFRADYTRWMKGERIVVKGNQVYWNSQSAPSNSYDSFWKYLQMVFAYAGTLSLEKELVSVSLKDLQIGDIFIQGGSPGHAVIVVDIATNPASNEKRFLLAQSYMPAQEIQILQNPNNAEISPWYTADIGEKLITPEWTFKATDLKRFPTPSDTH